MRNSGALREGWNQAADVLEEDDDEADEDEAEEDGVEDADDAGLLSEELDADEEDDEAVLDAAGELLDDEPRLSFR